MPTQRLSMRRIKEVLRLKHVQGLPERAIARTLGVSNGVVHGYLTRARAAGLSWPLPEGMTDEGLELLLFPAPRPASQSPQRPVPDWSYVDKLVAGDWIDRHENLLVTGGNRPGQKLVSLRARPQGLPRQPISPLSSRSKAVRGARAGARRRTLRPAPQKPRPRSASDFG